MSHDTIVLYPTDCLYYSKPGLPEQVLYAVPAGSPPVTITVGKAQEMYDEAARRSPSVTR